MIKSEQTKSKILATALDEFAEKGFAGARVDQIAQAAGVNKAMIYYYFASKEELFKELFELEMASLQRELAELLGKGSTASREDAAAVVRDLLEYITGKKKVLSVLMSGADSDEAIQPYLFQLLDFTTTLGLQISQKDGRGPRGDPSKPDAAALFHELFTGLLPLFHFVLLRDGLKARYGWDEEAMNERFIADWLHQHGGY